MCVFQLHACLCTSVKMRNLSCVCVSVCIGGVGGGLGGINEFVFLYSGHL